MTPLMQKDLAFIIWLITVARTGEHPDVREKLDSEQRLERLVAARDLLEGVILRAEEI